MRIEFTKMQGLGNDFVLLDAFRQDVDLGPGRFARLADRRYGVGCDQVLIIEPTARADADVRYRVVNADGLPAEHCGNGVRCVARYLAERGRVAGGRLRVEIGGGVFLVELLDEGSVRVDMGCPRFDPAALPLVVPARADRYPLAVDGLDYAFGAVSVGNPHAVFEVTDVTHAPLERIGPLLQDHPLFPQRVNVGFMQVIARDRIRLRVFERGAGETLACGTGACAAMAVGRRWGRLAARVAVELRGGTLGIEWTGEEGDRLWMSGPAATVFEGTIEL